MPAPLKRRDAGDKFTAREFNTLATAANAALKSSGSVQYTAGGLTVKQKGKTGRTFQEPAIMANALNVGATDLEVLDAVQISEGTEEQEANTGNPLSNYYDDRVLEVLVPNVTAHARVGVCFEAIPAGKIGKVCIAGVCMTWIELPKGRDHKPDRAVLLAGQTYLQMLHAGSAQVLWVSPWVLRGTVPESRRLAVVHIGLPRNCSPVGIIHGNHDKHWGECEVLEFDNSVTIEDVGAGQIRITPV